MPTNSLFRLTFPDGWKETTVHTFEGPLDGGVQHNLVLSILPELDKKVTLAEFARGQLSLSAKALPAFEMLSEADRAAPSGRALRVAVYKYTPADQVTYYQKQYFIIDSGRGYVFTSTFSKATLSTIADEVDKIVDSLTPVEPQ
ncbi:MAG TPA: DcrB-related protein [Chitinivibrionales bacterium]|jgi:hypothetical protein|nr:DcrB-related protein [Chitinivibrionales bacterium]